ncbi:hypothetical protein [Rhizosphaericola mali]|uniref:PBCV-specific basic adaptor domain-containing protein n=1 Tax=Rhizosphaericola mali TaxID=2545455 RepID=A0A5P2G7X4_9BACT|nr:hypothetical protein [Rhizosphaericola mali]QES90022.1 hypothetical protein E0W69_015605 [Rhizosphaericola mali]
MKKRIIIGLFALVSILAVSNVNAQSKLKKAVDNTGKAIGKTADKVGDKSAELAKKGVSKVGDKTYKGKVAPDGSDVYIDKKDKKYYINKEGKTIYLKASQIKNKVEKK